MNSESTSHMVNDLLQVLEDGREGFSKAAEAVKDPNLKLKQELSGDVRQEVESQAARVLAAHNKVRDLRDTAEAAS